MENKDICYSTSQNPQLSREIKNSISHYKNLTDEEKFIGTCHILQALRKWESTKLSQLSLNSIASKTPEWKSIISQISYARKLISSALEVSIKTYVHEELWVVTSHKLMKSATIKKWDGSITVIHYAK